MIRNFLKSTLPFILVGAVSTFSCNLPQTEQESGSEYYNLNGNYPMFIRESDNTCLIGGGQNTPRGDLGVVTATILNDDNNVQINIGGLVFCPKLTKAGFIYNGTDDPFTSTTDYDVHITLGGAIFNAENSDAEQDLILGTMEVTYTFSDGSSCYTQMFMDGFKYPLLDCDIDFENFHPVQDTYIFHRAILDPFFLP